MKLCICEIPTLVSAGETSEMLGCLLDPDREGPQGAPVAVVLSKGSQRTWKHHVETTVNSGTPCQDSWREHRLGRVPERWEQGCALACVVVNNTKGQLG